MEQTIQAALDKFEAVMRAQLARVDRMKEEQRLRRLRPARPDRHRRAAATASDRSSPSESARVLAYLLKDEVSRRQGGL